MNPDRPAYSEAFDSEAIRIVPSAFPQAGISREWGWGDSTGKGVRVAVVDSGVDADHPAIVNGVQGYVAVSEGPDGLVFDESPHRDAYGHGTACAGIIRSLAPDCEIYSVKVLGPTLAGKAAIFAGGLRWAIEHGMHVCNLSLGTTKHDNFGMLHEIADAAYFRNVVFVAAGNNMPKPSYPSVFSSVIAVASHDEHDPERFYVNPSPPVEFGARGIDVLVPWLDHGYLTATGNSFAAPHITGLVARIRSRHPHLTPSEVRVVLRMLASNARHGEEGR
jgi:subtilisin